MNDLSKLLSQPLFTNHDIARFCFTMDVAFACMWYTECWVYRVERSITNHLRDFAIDLEKFKVV